MVIPGYRTSAEIAYMYEVHISSVSRQCKLGKIPGAVRTPRGEWLIPVEVSEHLNFAHYRDPRGHSKDHEQN